MLMINNVTQYAKQVQMQMKANRRIQNPYLEPENLVEKFSMAQQAKEASDSMVIENIRAKLKAGIRLTSEEMEILKKKAPALYRKAVEAEKERKAYNSKLRQCKSKEEVEKVKASAVSKFSAEISAAQSSGAGQATIMDTMESVQIRMAAVMNEHTKFVSSASYQRLPEREEDSKRKSRKQEPPRLESEKPKDPFQAKKQEKEDPLEELRKELKEELEQFGQQAPSTTPVEEDASSETVSVSSEGERPVSEPAASSQSPTQAAPAPTRNPISPTTPSRMGVALPFSGRA